MLKLYCSSCREEKDENEFTPFSKNPSLNDRNGRVVYCKKCCNQYMYDRGNSLDALKELLRIIDIPYIQKFAELAEDMLVKKRKNTNLVIKKNLYNDEEEVSGIETNQIQNTLYSCYVARIGLFPKKYVNFACSDGIRKDEDVEVEMKDFTDGDKKAQTSEKYLIKTYGEEIYKDKVKLSKAIELAIKECELHTNNGTKRQQKHRLKTHVTNLVDVGILNKKDYPFLFEEEVEVDVEIDDDVLNTLMEDILSEMTETQLREKWGFDFKIEDLVKFEKEYRELRKNYEIKTASHEKFLKHACIASIKANEAYARNDVDGAKNWMAIFKDVTSAGKLQPQQMSRADLSGGLNNFGEYYKSIEQAKKVIEILPEFKKQPKDDPDFVIYCIVQYVRRLKGLPDCTYEEIWDFYEELANSFEEGTIDEDIIKDMISNQGYDDEDVESGDEGDS